MTRSVAIKPTASNLAASAVVGVASSIAASLLILFFLGRLG